MGAGSVRRFLESFLALTFCDSTLLEQNNAHKMRTGWINPLQTNVSCRAVMFEIIVLTASYCWQHPSQYFLVWYNAGKMKHLEFFFSLLIILDCEFCRLYIVKPWTCISVINFASSEFLSNSFSCHPETISLIPPRESHKWLYKGKNIYTLKTLSRSTLYKF